MANDSNTIAERIRDAVSSPHLIAPLVPLKYLPDPEGYSTLETYNRDLERFTVGLKYQWATSRQDAFIRDWVKTVLDLEELDDVISDWVKTHLTLKDVTVRHFYYTLDEWVIVPYFFCDALPNLAYRPNSRNFYLIGKNFGEGIKVSITAVLHALTGITDLGEDDELDEFRARILGMIRNQDHEKVKMYLRIQGLTSLDEMGSNFQPENYEEIDLF